MTVELKVFIDKIKNDTELSGRYRYAYYDIIQKSLYFPLEALPKNKIPEILELAKETKLIVETVRKNLIITEPYKDRGFTDATEEQ